MDDNTEKDAGRNEETPKRSPKSEGVNKGLKARPSLQLFQSPAQRAQKAALQRSRGAAGAHVTPSRAGRTPAVSFGRGALSVAKAKGRVSLGKARSLTKKPSLEVAASPTGDEEGLQQQPEAGPSEQSGAAGASQSPSRSPTNPFKRLSPTKAAPGAKLVAASELERIRNAALRGQTGNSPPKGAKAANTPGPASASRPGAIEPLAASPVVTSTTVPSTSAPTVSEAAGTPGSGPVGGSAVPAFLSPPLGTAFGGTSSSTAAATTAFGIAAPIASSGFTSSFGGGTSLFGLPSTGAAITFGTPVASISAPATAPSCLSPTIGLFGASGGIGTFGAGSAAGASSSPAVTQSTTFGSGFLGASGGFGVFGSSSPSAFGTARASEPAHVGAAVSAPAATATPMVGLGGSTAFGGVSRPASASGDTFRPGSASENRSTQGMNRGAAALQRRAERFGALDASTDVEAITEASPAMLTPLMSGDLQGDDAIMDLDGEGGGRGTIAGTCTMMCPDAERSFRERMRDIDSFERSAEGGPPDLAVKKFARNVEQVASNFRTMETLQRTQSHLLALMNRRDVPLAKIHHFLWDRCRGVRQDLFVQGYEDEQAIGMYEEHVRFMILAEVELAGYTGDNFNSHLNLEQINKACISLNEMYEHARARGTPMPNEAEFRAYHLLTLMGTHGKYEYNPAEFLQALKGCEPVRSHPSIVRVMEMRRWLASGAWALFLSKALDAPYLQAALAHLYFRAIRAHALKVMAHNVDGPAQNAKAFRLEHLQQELLLDSPEQAQQLCEALDLEITIGPQGPTATLPRGFAPSSRNLPDLPSELISRKGRELRSEDVAEATVPAQWNGQQLHTAQPTQQRPQQIPMAEQQMHALASPADSPAQQQLAEEQARRAAQWQAEQALRKEAERAAEAEAVLREQARREAAEAAMAARAEAERKARAAEEARRAAELQRQQEEEQRRKAAEEAARLRELEAQRVRAEQERLERERREREEAAKLAAEAAEKRRLEEARVQREAAERARLAAEEAEARRRREEQQRRQEAARQAFVAKRERRIATNALARWVTTVGEMREARRQEERRLQALAGCQVGILQRPPAKLRRPLTPPRSRSPLGQIGKRREMDSQEADCAPSRLASQVAAALGQGLAHSSPSLRQLFYKLLLLRTPTDSSGSMAGPAAWLRRALSVGRNAERQSAGAPDAGPSGRASDGLLASQGFDVAPAGEPPLILRVAVRDASHLSQAADLEAAASSTSGLLLLLDRTDDPSDVSPRLRALTRALPAAEAAKPQLLVLVVGQALVDPVQAWLDEEVSSGLRVGHTNVLSLPDAGLALGSTHPDSEKALLEGLTWLAQCAKQPALHALSLADVARQQTEACLAALFTTGHTQPGDLITAFNTALQGAVQQLQAAASLAAALRGWPPEDCFAAQLDPTFPAGWWQADRIRRQEQVLLALALPPFSPKLDNSLDAAVQNYVAYEAKVALFSSPGSPQPWRQVLLDTFQVQLSCLDTTYPAIVLQSAAKQIVHSTTIAAEGDVRPFPKRKWSLASAQVDSAASSAPKVPRYTAASPGTGEVARRMARFGAERRKSAGDAGAFAKTQDLFADLEVQSREDTAGKGVSEKLRHEAEEHTAWLESLLNDEGSSRLADIGGRRSEEGIARNAYSEEIQRTFAMTKWLQKLKGGF